jgi:hypothetical protein
MFSNRRLIVAGLMIVVLVGLAVAIGWGRSVDTDATPAQAAGISPSADTGQVPTPEPVAPAPAAPATSSTSGRAGGGPSVAIAAEESVSADGAPPIPAPPAPPAPAPPAPAPAPVPIPQRVVPQADVTGPSISGLRLAGCVFLADVSDPAGVGAVTLAWSGVRDPELPGQFIVEAGSSRMFPTVGNRYQGSRARPLRGMVLTVTAIDRTLVGNRSQASITIDFDGYPC